MKSLLLFLMAGTATAQVDIINNAIGEFSIRMLNRTAEGGGRNTVFSAYSVSTALGMCLLGSKGETFLNMKENLGLADANISDIEDGFSDSVTELTPFAQPDEGLKGFVLSAANQLFVDESFSLSKSYRQRMRNIFHANATPVNFTHRGPEVQEEINSFVSNKTHKLIPKLLDEPLPSTTVMALVNALYFKGTWKKKMEERPSPKRFNAFPGGSNQTANWIGLTKSFKHAASEQLNAQFVEVPYASRQNSPVRTSMLFIVPDESLNGKFVDWLKDDNFTWSNIDATIRSMKRKKVDLTFPKFSLESEFSLKNMLTDLGMDIPFTARANFSKMAEKSAGNLHLSEVLHKAKIEVDEFGTEAAAASTATIMLMSMPMPVIPEVRLRIDRSFVAMIILRQEESFVPLFTAVVDQL